MSTFKNIIMLNFLGMSEMAFRDRLAEELNYHGFTNKEFAQKVGINIGTLGMYLYRGSIPSADVALKMAEVLNTTVEYLIKGDSKDSSLLKGNWRKREIYNIIDSFNDKQMEQFLLITRAFKNVLSL